MVYNPDLLSFCFRQTGRVQRGSLLRHELGTSADWHVAISDGVSTCWRSCPVQPVDRPAARTAHDAGKSVASMSATAWGPTGRSFDPGQPQLVVDGSETAYPCSRTKLVEHPHIRSAMPMGTTLQTRAKRAGFKKKKPKATRPIVPRWEVARSRPDKAVVSWATRSTRSGCGGVNTPPP
jgi:hypothetical protein